MVSTSFLGDLTLARSFKGVGKKWWCQDGVQMWDTNRALSIQEL